ncbi:MAG: hypothetical protein ACFFER_18580, partial [Candidatus Thorarchaeota archaeon]
MVRNGLISCIAMIVLFLGSTHFCMAGPFANADAPKTDIDEIVWETFGNPTYLDPHVNYESFGSWIFDNVYETLFTYPWDSSGVASDE